MFYEYTLDAKHIYTLAATGIKFKPRDFVSRAAAKEKMYKFMAKKGLRIVEIWDDHHDKTYCCNNGIKFYINRL